MERGLLGAYDFSPTETNHLKEISSAHTHPSSKRSVWRQYIGLGFRQITFQHREETGRKKHRLDDARYYQPAAASIHHHLISIAEQRLHQPLPASCSVEENRARKRRECQWLI